MCSNPFMIWTDGSINPKTGKRIFHFEKFTPDRIKDLNHKVKRLKLNRDYYLVPCGHCEACRLKYRKEWSLRLLNELEMSDNGYFLTITYNEDHIPFSKSLKKDDLVRFMKSLYKAIERYYKDNFINSYKQFRYFACGEYGDDGRPHYHAIVFNVPFTDFTKHIKTIDGLIIHKHSHSGSDLLQSETLDKIWKKGFIVADEVNYHTCSYVAGYVQKKLYGDEAVFYLDNYVLPPFLICSKGIGSSYFVAHKDKILETDEIFYRKDNKICVAGIPRYYLKLLEKTDIIDYSWIKSKRKKVADISTNEMINMPEKSLNTYFKSKRLSDKRKVSRLVRR